MGFESSLIQSNSNLFCFRLIGKLQKKKSMRVSRLDFKSLYPDGNMRQMRTQNIGFSQFLLQIQKEDRHQTKSFVQKE